MKVLLRILSVSGGNTGTANFTQNLSLKLAEEITYCAPTVFFPVSHSPTRLKGGGRVYQLRLFERKKELRGKSREKIMFGSKYKSLKILLGNHEFF
jgi:hypothetical protein